jgi:hypothetical protein
VWNAFARLSSRRSLSGFGAVGAIPYVEIGAYLDLVLKVDDEEDRQLFIVLLEHLDNHFLRDYAEKQRKESAKSKRSKPT